MDDTALAPPEEAALAPAAVAARLADERAADIVEHLNERTPEFAAGVLEQLAAEKAVEVLDQPGLEHAPETVSALPRDTAAALLAGMSADRVADVFRADRACFRRHGPHRPNCRPVPRRGRNPW